MAETPAHSQRMNKSEYSKVWYRKNKERVLQNIKRWQEANPEKTKSYKRKWEDNNKEYRKNYRATHREEASLRATQWNKDNPERARINAKKYRDTHPELEREKTQRRRARKRELLTEKVFDIDIFERDEWICKLCGDPVDRNIAWPDPLSKSLDHIIPISISGSSHTIDNLQLAHLACNSRKRNVYVKD